LKEYERNFELFEQKINAQIQDKIVQKSSNFEFFFENNLKEMKSKLDEKLNIQMKKISELSKNSQKERVLCFEKLQTQNY